MGYKFVLSDQYGNVIWTLDQGIFAPDGVYGGSGVLPVDYRPDALSPERCGSNCQRNSGQLQLSTRLRGPIRHEHHARYYGYDGRIYGGYCPEQALVTGFPVPDAAPVVVSRNVAIGGSGNVTIPSGSFSGLYPTGCVLQVIGGNITITGSSKLIIGGVLSAPPVLIFNESSTGTVQFGNASTGSAGGQPEIFAEWWGAVPNSNGTGTTGGTDCSSAINAAITALGAINSGAVSCGTPLTLNSGLYLLTAPINTLMPGVHIRGRGRFSTTLVAQAGFAGPMMQESLAGAAKIILEDFALYGNNVSTVTYGLYLGYQNVASPHGTEGYIRGLFIQGVTSGTGYAVFGNVGMYDLISVWNCANNIVTNGSGNMYSKIVSEGNVGAGTGVVFNGVISCTIRNRSAGHRLDPAHPEQPHLHRRAGFLARRRHDTAKSNHVRHQLLDLGT